MLPLACMVPRAPEADEEARVTDSAIDSVPRLAVAAAPGGVTPWPRKVEPMTPDAVAAGIEMVLCETSVPRAVVPAGVASVTEPMPRVPTKPDAAFPAGAVTTAGRRAAAKPGLTQYGSRRATSLEKAPTALEIGRASCRERV